MDSMASEASRETEAILLEKGRIVDGSGEESWIGDVLIVGDRIQAVGLDLRNELPSGVKKIGSVLSTAKDWLSRRDLSTPIPMTMRLFCTTRRILRRFLKV